MGVRNAAYNLQCWADNIVVTMGGGIADEDVHDIDDKHGNDDHNDLVESQMIELHLILSHKLFVSWLRLPLLSFILTIPLRRTLTIPPWMNMTPLARRIAYLSMTILTTLMILTWRNTMTPPRMKVLALRRRPFAPRPLAQPCTAGLPELVLVRDGRHAVGLVTLAQVSDGRALPLIEHLTLGLGPGLDNITQII